MSQPLTDRNGVVCPRCFTTIVLTGKTMVRPMEGGTGKVFTTMERFFGQAAVFRVVCPKCHIKSTYDYEEVRPIAPSWEQEKQNYEAKIRILETEKAQAIKDAKTLAKVAHEGLQQNEDEEQQSNVPPNANEPKLEKKKDEQPTYLQ